jgi:hypothetical protein
VPKLSPIWPAGRNAPPWAAREKRADDGAPVGKGGRLAKVDGVVFQRVPEDLQDVALGAFNAFVDLVALKALGLGNHFADAALDGFVKGGLLAGVDADVGEFENHEKSSCSLFSIG